MPGERLESHVSGSIARTNPLENTPEMQAIMGGTRIIASTMGDFATRLMDHLDCDPAEAIYLLGVSDESLADPHIFFQGGRGFDSFESHWRRQFEQVFQKDLTVELQRLEGIVDTVMSGYLVDDTEQAKQQAEAIQEEISEELSRRRNLPTNELSGADEAELEQKQNEMAIKCMKRDALNSGVYIGVDEFVRVMLSTHVIDPEIGSEMGAQWVEAILDAVDAHWREAVRPDITVGEMVGGRELFTTMKSNLSSGMSQLSYRYTDDLWEKISPIFFARKLEDIALINGSDRSEEALAAHGDSRR